MNREEYNEQELSIFEPAPTGTSLQTREWIQYGPVNQISDNSAVDVNIPPQSSAYIDLKHSVLNVKLRITKADMECSGSVVECLTQDRRVAGSSLTGVTALWSLSKTHLS